MVISTTFKHEPSLAIGSTWNLLLLFCHYLWGNLQHSDFFLLALLIFAGKKFVFLQIWDNLCGCPLSQLMICFQSLYSLRLKFFSRTPFLYSISHIFLPSDVFFICCFNCLRFRLKIWPPFACWPELVTSVSICVISWESVLPVLQGDF